MMGYIDFQPLLNERQWNSVNGASEFEVAKLLDTLPFAPPCEYLSLIRLTNGGYGELSLLPMWFQLFEIEFALQLWKDENYRINFPDFFFFGSNGGLETIALKTGNPSLSPIFMVDCIAGLESAKVIAPNMSSFIGSIGFRYEK